MADQASNTRLENEAEIVKKAKTNDEAFAVLYDYYFSKIYGYLFKRTGNHEVTEDLVSDTFLKVFSNLKKYEHQGHTFGAWVYKIATNNLIDYYRKAGRKQEVNIEEVRELSDNKPGPGELVQGSENREEVKMVLGKLTSRYQEVLHLKYFAEMRSNEIAETLGISANNTRVLTYRALKNFQKIYEKHVK